MSNQRPLPGIGEHFNGQTPPVGYIDQASAGWVRNDKLILRVMDITAAGTEVNLGECGEIALYSDIPLDVALNRSERYYGDRTDFRYKGRIDKLYLRTSPQKFGVWPGRVVIYVGRPALGVDFQRETWRDKIGISAGLDVALLGTWLTPLASITALTFLQIPDGSIRHGVTFTRFRECAYIRSFRFVRSTGTITRLEYVESETGAGHVLFDAVDDWGGSDELSHTYDTPPRITGPGTFILYGSAEAADTTIDGGIILSTI